MYEKPEMVRMLVHLGTTWGGCHNTSIRWVPSREIKKANGAIDINNESSTSVPNNMKPEAVAPCQNDIC